MPSELELWHEANPEPEVPPFIHFVDGDPASGALDPLDPGHTVIPFGELFVYSEDHMGAFGDDWWTPQKAWFSDGSNPNAMRGWHNTDPAELATDDGWRVWAIMVHDPPSGIEGHAT
jgi:hypothetical protein